MKTFTTVDDYLSSFPADIRKKLEEIRKTIKKAAPKAEEAIAYGIPGYKQNGPVMYFAGYKTHIGIYPRPAVFKKELEKYEGGKGTVKLKLDEPLPLKLISDMVKYQVIKNTKKKEK